MPTEDTTPVYLEHGDGLFHGVKPHKIWRKWRDESMSREAAETMKAMLEKQYPEWKFRITEGR